MDSQDGKALISILLTVLIVFGFMWLAVPWLQKSTKSGNESAAIATLQAIHQAQRDSFGSNQMYDSIRKLVQLKFLAQGFGGDSFTSGGYEFYHSVSGSRKTWCAVAVPQMQPDATAIGQAERRSGSVYGIDETGVVMQDVSPSACYAGTLNTAGGSPVR